MGKEKRGLSFASFLQRQSALKKFRHARNPLLGKKEEWSWLPPFFPAKKRFVHLRLRFFYRKKQQKSAILSAFCSSVQGEIIISRRTMVFCFPPFSLYNCSRGPKRCRGHLFPCFFCLLINFFSRTIFKKWLLFYFCPCGNLKFHHKKLANHSPNNGVNSFSFVWD